MARNNKYTEKINNANYEANTTLTAEEQATLAGFPGNGYYSRANLGDIINNFIVSHVGADKVLQRVPRHEVAYWAQRAVQEFSYDILHAEKSIEIEVGPSLSLPLPSDFVTEVALYLTSEGGGDLRIYKDKNTTAKRGALQDNEYKYLYDENGEIMVANQSQSVENFKNAEPRTNSNFLQDAFGYFSDDIYDYYYSGYFGRRYGLDPTQENYNPTYILDEMSGIIHFGSAISMGNIISMRYISDGLCENGDLSKVYVPKLAEDAIYAYILYSLSKVRPTAANFVPVYKKEMSAKMRNAKLRLTDYKLEEFEQLMRGKAKWIKH